MALIYKIDGWQPICNDCGIALCFTISDDEKYRFGEFWENWRCQYCDPYVIGSFSRWLKSHEPKDSLTQNLNSGV